MTREEAIEEIKCNWPDSRYTILREALDMAISALREQEGKDTYAPTNADRIRSMTDEELADMLWKTGRNYRAVCADPVVDYNEHRDHLIEWIQQPAEGG